ncbi:transporter [Magnetofaba australis]|uniref:transporter n=1 Tax=Magnetofaba australis TaxID=1472297 RepID=UPI001301A1B3|nr:transporter [Magnetofaba australis]
MTLHSWLYATLVHSAVNDVFPGDYIALPAGASSATLYHFHRKQEGAYVSGARSNGYTIDSDYLVLRVNHVLQVGSLRVAPLLVTGAARGAVDGVWPANKQRDAGGMLDTRFGVTLWPIADAAKRRWLGLTAMLIAPTGEYDGSELINPGENRWREVVMAGWVQGIAQQWTLELIGEAAWYGQNDAFAGSNTFDQRPSQALTGYLRRDVGAGHSLYVGGQLNWGGASELNGQPWRGGTRNRRLFLGGVWRVSPQWLLNGRLARDLSIDTGDRMHTEMALRVIRLFFNLKWRVCAELAEPGARVYASITRSGALQA